MKFITSEEIDAPATAVWAVLTDTAGLEAEARERGLPVRRVPESPVPAWVTEFRFRRRQREVEIRQQEVSAPDHIRLELLGRAAEGTIRLDLLPLTPQRCRLTVTSELRPRSLAARLFLQSLRLARQAAMRRYRNRIAVAARSLEARARGSGMAPLPR